MRIVVLCNHQMGLPTIDLLMNQGLIAGIACPAIPSENLFRLQMICQTQNIPFGIIEENAVERNLNDFVKKCKAEMVVILTFPYKIPAKALRTPKYGYFNFHTAILPEYRGADPTFWAIVKGEAQSGVTVHKVNEKLDQGDIAFIEYEEITSEETYGQHIQKLAMTMRKAAERLINEFSTLQLMPQDPSRAKYYSRPNFMDLLIDWSTMTAVQIKALVRASNPTYGGAMTFFRGVPIHILQVSLGSSATPPETEAGTIISANKDSLIVLSSDKKLVRLDVVYSEDGFFTGGKLVTTFNIKEKEESFTAPPFPTENNQ